MLGAEGVGSQALDLGHSKLHGRNQGAFPVVSFENARAPGAYGVCRQNTGAVAEPAAQLSCCGRADVKMAPMTTDARRQAKDVPTRGEVFERLISRSHRAAAIGPQEGRGDGPQTVKEPTAAGHTSHPQANR